MHSNRKFSERIAQDIISTVLIQKNKFHISKTQGDRLLIFQRENLNVISGGNDNKCDQLRT